MDPPLPKENILTETITNAIGSLLTKTKISIILALADHFVSSQLPTGPVRHDDITK